MEWLIGLISLGGLWLVIVVVGLFRQRIDTAEQELEDWSGVLDVRRKTRDKLDSDPQYTERVQNEFND